MEIAVAGSSGLGRVLGLPAEPTGLLAALPAEALEHLLVLTPRHLERRSREQAHVVVAARPRTRVGVLALDHHALTLTLLAASVLPTEGAADGWAEPGQAVQLLRQAAARSRSLVWHPRALGLRWPVPSVAQSALSLARAGGYLAELGQHAGLARAAVGLRLDGHETLYVAGDPPPLLARQLGEVPAEPVAVTSEPAAPYRTRRSVELCGLAGPAWPPLHQAACAVCGAGRPLTGCVFCGTGVQPGPARSESRAAAVAVAVAG